MQGADADRDAALVLQQCLQVADAPDRHQQSVRLGALFQRLLQEGTGGCIQRRGAATS